MYFIQGALEGNGGEGHLHEVLKNLKKKVNLCQ